MLSGSNTGKHWATCAHPQYSKSVNCYIKVSKVIWKNAPPVAVVFESASTCHVIDEAEQEDP